MTTTTTTATAVCGIFDPEPLSVPDLDELLGHVLDELDQCIETVKTVAGQIAERSTHEPGSLTSWNQNQAMTNAEGAELLAGLESEFDLDVDLNFHYAYARLTMVGRTAQLLHARVADLKTTAPSAKCRTGLTDQSTELGFECIGAENPVGRLGQGRRAQNSSPNPTNNHREPVDQSDHGVKKSGRPLTLTDGRDRLPRAVETLPPGLAPLLAVLCLAAMWRAVGYFEIPNPVGMALIIATGVCGVLLATAEMMQLEPGRKRRSTTSSASNVDLDAIDSSEVAA